MKLNEFISVLNSEKGFVILKLESLQLNLETLLSIPNGLEKIKQFSNLSGVVLFIEKLKGPSFHDFNLYIQKEGLLANYIDAGKNCISSFNNFSVPFGIYVEKFVEDMAIEFLIEVPKLIFSPKAYLKWNYYEIPIFPIFGSIRKFFDFFGLEKAFKVFVNGNSFYLKNILNGMTIPKHFLMEGLEYYFKKGNETKTLKENYLKKKLQDYFFWKRYKNSLKDDFFELSQNIVSFYLKDKLFQEEEEIFQRNYLLKEKIQNKLKYLVTKEELYNQEVLKETNFKKSFLVLGFSKEGKSLIQRALQKNFKTRIVEKNPNILKENLSSIPKDKRYSISTEYFSFERYPIIFENLSCKEEEKVEIIGSLSSSFEISGIFLVSLKTINLKSIEKRFSHPTRILGYCIPPALPKNDFVEIIKGSRTSQESIKIASKFFSSLGYFPIVVSDKPGFLTLRMISYLLNEAFYLLEEGFPPLILEKAFKIYGFKKGPLQLGDEIGFSILSNIVQINSLSSKEFPPVNRIFSVLAELERFEKRFPIKFFSYKDNNIYKENKKLIKHLGLKFSKKEISNEEFEELSERLLISSLNISFNSIEAGVVDWADKVDLALSFVIGPTSSNLGIIKYCDNLGWQHIISITNRLISKYGIKYSPCKSIQDLSSDY